MKHLIMNSIKNKLSILILTLFALSISTANSQDLVINEIMAVNNATMQDDDDDYSDWIEIHNIANSEVNLQGWYLSDDETNLSKWVFPSILIPAKGYLLVFASGKDRSKVDSALHTNFKLSGSGEYLALVKPDGARVANAFEPEYSIQYPDVSYGRLNGRLAYFSSPTPGVENVKSLFFAPPQFSVSHGYFEETFDLELIKTSDELKIYYTLDASTPSKSNGTLYTTTIAIKTTTIVRAVSYDASDAASATVTASYIFPAHVKNQSKKQNGYPDTWLSPIHGTDDYDRIPANYDIKADILSQEEVSSNLEASLKSLPVLSVVTDIDNLFSESRDSLKGGIYTYNGEPNGPTKDLTYHLGRGWKRAASVEYFNADNTDDKIDFQANCAIKMHGGATRTRYKTEKHSFKIGFNSAYGPSKLEEKVFGKGSPKKYDWLVLRGGFAPRIGLQVKDPWAKQTVRDMGQYAAYNKFVHVYINGLYWGMYNLSERMDGNSMRDNLGGSASDYDIVKDYYELEAGDTKAWDKLVAYAQDDIEEPENYQYLLGNNEDGTPNASYEKLINAENFIDYMLMNIYAGTGDWDHHNWAAARRKTKSEGFHFLTWDAEGVFKDVTLTNIIEKSNDNRPTGVFSDLLNNEQFHNNFIRHVNMHFFQEGALTPTPCLNRYDSILGIIDTALIADQARWEIDEKDIWNIGYHDFKDDYFPKRTENVFRQLVSSKLYPVVDFPKLSTSNNSIPDTLELFLSTSSEGKILYTIDGTDPGYLNPLENESIKIYDGEPFQLEVGEITINARVKEDSLWSRLMTKSFNVKSTNTTSTPEQLVETIKIHSYPNPIENEMHLAFSLNETAHINVNIYSVYGELVATVIDETLNKGESKINYSAEHLSSGVYICVFENRDKGIVSKVKLFKN